MQVPSATAINGGDSRQQNNDHCSVLHPPNTITNTCDFKNEDISSCLEDQSMKFTMQHNEPGAIDRIAGPDGDAGRSA